MLRRERLRPRTRWFIATGTAAASRCIKGKHPTARRAEPGLSQPSPASPPWQQLPVLLRPSCPPVPRQRVDSEGPRRGGGCGLCMWEKVRGLHCHVIQRSFSQVSLGRAPEPRFCGLREARSAARSAGAGRAPAAVGAGWKAWALPSAAQSAAVSGDFLCHGVGLGRAALGLGRGLRGCPAAPGWGGRTPAAAHPEVLWPRPCRRRCGLALPRRRGGRRRRSRAAPGAAALEAARVGGRGLSGCASGRFRSLSDRTEERWRCRQNLGAS